MFQIYFRTISAIFGIIVLFYITFRLSSMSFKLWHLEQKLTIPLLGLLILFNNPLYFFMVSKPNPVFIIYDSIFTNLFNSYLKFFILCLFDSLRYKNRNTNSCFFIPKCIFIIIFFGFNIVHSINHNIQSFSDIFASALSN